MALTFGGAATNRVQVAAAASINALNPFTFALWVYPTTLSSGMGAIQKGRAGTSTRRAFYPIGTSGALELYVDRGTADTVYITSSTPLTTNAWHFIAATFDSAGGAGEVGNIYAGTLAAAAAELSYATATDGSGTLASDASETLYLGNIAALDDPFRGRIAWAGIWNRKLALGELRAQQFRPHKTSGCVGFWHLGWNGVSTQPDWSGNGNAGTVTGATVGAHVPLGAPFAGDEWQPYAVAAAPQVQAPRRLRMLMGVGY